MDEKDYQMLEKLVNEGYVIKAERHQGNGINRYTFTMKPIEGQNIANKYKTDVYHAYEAWIDKMDNLVLTQKMLKKEKKIRKLQIVSSAVLITTLISGYSVMMHKKNQFRDSVMDEVNSRVEQMESELPPNMDVPFSTREHIYNEVIKERRQNLENIDNQIANTRTDNKEKIESLKKEKEQLIELYTQTNSENAKSK